MNNIKCSRGNYGGRFLLVFPLLSSRVVSIKCKVLDVPFWSRHRVTSVVVP